MKKKCCLGGKLLKAVWKLLKLLGLAYVILFLVIYLVLRLILRLSNLINHIPILGGVNRIAGAVIGLAEGVIFLWVICMIIMMMSGTDFGITCERAIVNSPFLNFIYAAEHPEDARSLVLAQPAKAQNIERTAGRKLRRRKKHIKRAGHLYDRDILPERPQLSQNVRFKRCPYVAVSYKRGNIPALLISLVYRIQKVCNYRCASNLLYPRGKRERTAGICHNYVRFKALGAHIEIQIANTGGRAGYYCEAFLPVTLLEPSYSSPTAKHTDSMPCSPECRPCIEDITRNSVNYQRIRTEQYSHSQILPFFPQYAEVPGALVNLPFK